MRRTSPLQILDEYAKRITSKQAKMLYEHKTHKTYKKKLYEASFSSDKYSVFISDDMCYNCANETLEFIIDGISENVADSERINIVRTDKGASFETSSLIAYQSLMEYFESYGIQEDKVCFSHKSIRTSKEIF